MLDGRIRAARAANRIAADDGLQDEGVVGIHPERHLRFSRPRLVGRRRDVERRHVSIERSARRLQRAIVDQPVADVDVENLIERAVERIAAGRRRRLLRAPRGDETETERQHNSGRTARRIFVIL